jgi:hypothetical protein
MALFLDKANLRRDLSTAPVDQLTVLGPSDYALNNCTRSVLSTQGGKPICNEKEHPEEQTIFMTRYENSLRAKPQPAGPLRLSDPSVADANSVARAVRYRYEKGRREGRPYFVTRYRNLVTPRRRLAGREAPGTTAASGATVCHGR